MRRASEASLIAAATAEEEHAAELAQGPEAAIGDDPLGAVQGRDMSAEEPVLTDAADAVEAEDSAD